MPKIGILLSALLVTIMAMCGDCGMLTTKGVKMHDVPAATSTGGTRC